MSQAKICLVPFLHTLLEAFTIIFDDLALSIALDFKCNECGKSFVTESDLKGHKQLHHRQQQEQTRFVYGMIVISNSYKKLSW